MRVPKLVKNGFNSWFRGWVSFDGMDSEYRPGLAVNAKKRIITIFDHFRNNHAPYLSKTLRNLKINKVDIIQVYRSFNDNYDKKF
jgi:hypothetical protein